MLHAARWKYRTQKNRHFGTIAQLFRAISLELRHISTIGKNLLSSNTSSACRANGPLWPTSGWDLLASLGHPYKFQRVSRLGTITARHSSKGRQPNFAALNRGRHLYSAGRPPRWALAHISSQWCWTVAYSSCKYFFQVPQQYVLAKCLIEYASAVHLTWIVIHHLQSE